MHRGKLIAVNVAAYNEDKMIAGMLESIPAFVDFIVVVDDCSTDSTSDIVRMCQVNDQRIQLIQLLRNKGFGGATVTGYQYLMGQYVNVVANLNGDGQMDAGQLLKMVEKLQYADLVKGDRLSHPDAGRMPLIRRLGGHLLSWCTSYVTGQCIRDSQHTYHVIGVDALKSLRLERLYKRFGYPNDFLIECTKQGLFIKNHTVKPIYGQGESSDLKPFKVWPRILWILFKGWIHIRAARIAGALDINQQEKGRYEL